MNWFLTIGLLLAGIGFLYGGAELLVRGASSLARGFGIRPLIVGLTVVAFATSLPEALVSILASIKGQNSIAIANVVGSNILNMGLVLGTAALVYPIMAPPTLFRRELPLLIAASLLLPLLLINGVLGRLEGILLLSGIVVFTMTLVRQAVREGPFVDVALQGVLGGRVEGEHPRLVQSKPGLDVLKVVAGLILLLLGARALILSAVDIASALGISERVIGLTIVAGGTSLPELAATLVASLRKEPDIGLGNLIGSNLFNIFFVLGICSTISPIRMDLATMRTDFLFMIGITLLLVPMVRTSWRVSRVEGVILLASYGAFLTTTLTLG